MTNPEGGSFWPRRCPNCGSKSYRSQFCEVCGYVDKNKQPKCSRCQDRPVSAFAGLCVECTTKHNSHTSQQARCG